MENIKKRPKIRYRRAPTALKIVLSLLILLSMGALVTLGLVHDGIEKRTQELTQEAADAENKRDTLQEKIDNLDSVESVRDIAREELGLVDPNTILITPEQQTEPSGQ